MGTIMKCIAERRKRHSQRVRKVTTLVGAYALLFLCKEPQQTNEYIGATWVRDVLHGNVAHSYDMF